MLRESRVGRFRRRRDSPFSLHRRSDESFRRDASNTRRHSGILSDRKHADNALSHRLRSIRVIIVAPLNRNTRCYNSAYRVSLVHEQFGKQCDFWMAGGGRRGVQRRFALSKLWIASNSHGEQVLKLQIVDPSWRREHCARRIPIGIIVLFVIHIFAPVLRTDALPRECLHSRANYGNYTETTASTAAVGEGAVDPSRNSDSRLILRVQLQSKDRSRNTALYGLLFRLNAANGDFV